MNTNQVAPVYDLFLAPLAVSLNPTDFECVVFAYISSKYGHANQEREDGSRYFDHPKGAAWIYIHELGGRDPRVIIDLLLHDISEDAYLISLYRISRNFGEDIALDVRALTKLPKGKEKTEEYLQRIIDRGPWAIIAKLIDRLHNLRTLGACSPEKQARQLKETEQHHIPILIPALAAHGGQWKEYADMLEKKIVEAIEMHKEATH